MPTSISTSRRSPWRRGFVAAGVASAGFFVLAETVAARAMGLEPSVSDGPALWSAAREQASAGTNAKLIFAGASRSAFGSDLMIAQATVPHAQPLQLAIRGSNVAPVLHDLANDPPPAGWVVASFAAPSLEAQALARSHAHIRYYRDQWRPALRWELAVDTFVQRHTNARQALRRLTVLGQAALRGRASPQLDASVTAADRQVSASAVDLRATNAGLFGAKRAAAYREARRLRHQSPSKWRAKLTAVLDDVARLQNAGIGVAFVRYPSSDRHLSAEREAYPRHALLGCARTPLSSLRMHHRPLRRRSRARRFRRRGWDPPSP